MAMNAKERSVLIEVIENQEKIQEEFRKIGKPEEGLELPHNLTELKRMIR